MIMMKALTIRVAVVDDNVAGDGVDVDDDGVGDVAVYGKFVDGDDADWDDGEGRSKAFDARPGSNQPMKNQGWEHGRGAGSMRSKGHEDDWDDVMMDDAGHDAA